MLHAHVCLKVQINILIMNMNFYIESVQLLKIWNGEGNKMREGGKSMHLVTKGRGDKSC